MDNTLNIIDERDLHCVLNKYCSEVLDIKMKTIYHEQSTKSKGKSEWLHPDMVGFQLTTSKWNDNIINVCKDFHVSKALLYSFELKKVITVDTLREYYFQAVSNSSWANEGYLVALSIDENNSELISEIKRLVGAFGIGIIKVDLENPYNSSILFPAKRKDTVDGETMNKLYSINPNYREYIQGVSNSLQINRVIDAAWDNIEDYNKLLNKINHAKNSLKNKKSDARTKPVDIIEDKEDVVVRMNNNRININDNSSIFTTTLDNNIKLSFTKPIRCIVDNMEHTGENWAQILLNMAISFKRKDLSLFDEYVSKSRYFSLDNSYKESVYNKELGLYTRPLDSNGKYKEIQLLLKIYNMDLSNSMLYYEFTNK